ncbi:MAG: SDR family oxidoreductase [Hyphomicrobiales bacterium]
MLEGNTALVTGAGGGLGLAVAQTFAGQGACGLGLDVLGRPEPFPETWLFQEGNVTRERDVAAAVEAVSAETGRLDVVVANAGVVPPWRETGDIDLDEWDLTFAVNVRGVIASIKHAVPRLRENGGSIVVMGSLNSVQGHERQCLYAATKHAVLGIVRSTARDLGRFGIRVNALAPGPVATGALKSRAKARATRGGPSAEETLEAYAAQTALGRLATEQDVANAALFLASPLANGITGQMIPVDAGLV